MSGDAISKAYRLVNALLGNETVNVSQAAKLLDIKIAKNARPYVLRAQEIEGVEVLEQPLRARLKMRRDGPTDDVAIAACFGASLATLFEGSKYETGMREAVGYVTGATHEPSKFQHLRRKFFFVRRGGERALPDKSSLLELLVRAVLRERRVTLSYKDASGKPSKGVVEPLSLAVYDHQIYLVARRVSDGERRLYRFSRITDVRVREQFKYPDDQFEPRRMFADTFGVRIGEKRPRERLRILLGRDWRHFVATHRWHDSQDHENTPRGVIVQLDVKICDEVIAWVRSFGSEAEVLEPRWLKKKIAADARKTAKLYDEGREPRIGVTVRIRGKPARRPTRNSTQGDRPSGRAGRSPRR